MLPRWYRGVVHVGHLFERCVVEISERLGRIPRWNIHWGHDGGGSLVGVGVGVGPGIWPLFPQLSNPQLHPKPRCTINPPTSVRCFISHMQQSKQGSSPPLSLLPTLLFFQLPVWLQARIYLARKTRCLKYQDITHLRGSRKSLLLMQVNWLLDWLTGPVIVAAALEHSPVTIYSWLFHLEIDTISRFPVRDGFSLWIPPIGLASIWSNYFRISSKWVDYFLIGIKVYLVSLLWKRSL